MTEERRYQKQRERLRDLNGKAVTVHLPANVLHHIDSIIKFLSEKDDRLTMRDAICLAITAYGDRVGFVHSQSKTVLRKAGEPVNREENRAIWKKIRKECRDMLTEVRANYPKIPRGRRPKGWTPPSEEPEWTPEEADRAYAQAQDEHDRIQEQKERDAAGE